MTLVVLLACHLLFHVNVFLGGGVVGLMMLFEDSITLKIRI